MSTGFSRTLRSLDADRYRRAGAGLLAAVVFGLGWALWCTVARVTLYEVTTAARVEVDRSVYPVASPFSGRVVSARLAVGREVTEGEILLELDAAAEQLQIKEERARQQALRVQLAALREEASSEERAHGEERREARSGGDELRARAREAEAASRLAADDADRAEQLRKSGLISERDYQTAKSEALRRRASSESAALAVEHYAQQQLTRDSDRGTRGKSLQTEIARLESQIPPIQAAIDRLSYEIERRYVRAPMTGRLGEAAVLRTGAVIHQGDKLAAIVPAGRLGIVAQFAPESALGRVRPGQPARVRLDGFPWMQYGTVAATVSNVASEVRDGSVRVELRIEHDPSSRIPLQHGLPGTVEIAVERATPWTLLMRHAGRMMAEPISAQPELRAEAR
jgi:multidrug resistance efflux pump